MATIVKCPHCNLYNILKGHTFPRNVYMYAKIPQLCKFAVSHWKLYYLYTYKNRIFRVEMKNPIRPTKQGLYLFHSVAIAIADRSSALKLMQAVDKLAPLTAFIAYISRSTQPSYSKAAKCFVDRVEVTLHWQTPNGTLDFALPSLTLIQPPELNLEQFAYIAQRRPDFQLNAESVSFRLFNDVWVSANVLTEALCKTENAPLPP